MSGDIFLNIDRIVLHGLGHVDGKALATSLEQALLDELKLNSVCEPAELARVQTQIKLPETLAAGQIGQALAQSLHGVISNTAAAAKRGPTGKQGGKQDA